MQNRPMSKFDITCVRASFLITLNSDHFHFRDKLAVIDMDIRWSMITIRSQYGAVSHNNEQQLATLSA